MKKSLEMTAFAAAALLLATGATVVAAESNTANAAPLYKDGVYTGEGAGRASIIKVAVTVKEGKVKDVKILEHRDTAMKMFKVKSDMIPQIIEKNGIEGVDAASGATMSSRGVKTAVSAALTEAKRAAQE